VLAGYTLGGADLLRRAMGKKKPEEMAKQRSIFVTGAVKNDVPESQAAHIFDLMEKFAGYGFNKSHSAAYALLSYQTGWLKAHEPAAYMAAVLSADMDHTDKVVGLLYACRTETGLKVLPPHVNLSAYDFTVVDEGYPRPVTEWAQREGLDEALAGPLDAVQVPDGRVFLLTGASGWGRVRNAFENLATLDAAQATGSTVQLYAAGQVLQYSDSVENDGVRGDEGYPRAIHDVPAAFEGGVDAVFTDPDGVLHLFRAGRTASVGEGVDAAVVPTAQRWGVLPPILPSGVVDAAFAGLDGRTYLFSGGTYLRYSTADYTHVDEGYPRTLGEWREDEGPHVRLAAHFRFALDASFQGLDGTVHLFKGDRCLAVGGDEQPLAEVWGRVRNSFDQAERIDAGYTVGTTQFLFSGPQVVGYTDSLENSGVRVDDGSPQRIEALLDDVPPEFENAVDAALVDGDHVVHLFKDGKTVALTSGTRTVEPTTRRWGVLGPVLPSDESTLYGVRGAMERAEKAAAGSG